MIIKPGQTVTFTHYGETRHGTVTRVGRNGNLVFVRDDSGRERWLHRDSVAAA